MPGSNPGDAADSVPTARAVTGGDAPDRVADALTGLVYCLVALQFTIAGVFGGSSV